jgi:hypothetical protein
MNSIDDQHEHYDSQKNSQIDDQDDTAMLGALFDEHLMPLAERLNAEGKSAFPLAPDVSWLSYYVRRKRSAMVADDFTHAACADSAELELRLAAHWAELGRHELAALAPQFARVAQAARARHAGQVLQAELSPYVYAMF